MALQLARWGVTPEQLTWLDVPPAASYAQARQLLERLVALHGAKLTPHGEAMAQLPAHPRIAHLLIRGHDPKSDPTDPVRFWFTVGGAVEAGEDLRTRKAEQVMHPSPRSIAADALAVATPADWRPGDAVIVPTAGSCGTAKERMEGKEESVTCIDWFFCTKDVTKEAVFAAITK